MNEQARTKLLDRIRKILALAGNNPNEHEAAAANEKVQAMLAEANLSMADVQAKSRKEDEAIIVDKSMMTDSVPWRRSMAMMVGEMYFCGYYFMQVKTPTANRKNGYIRYDRHCFFGEPQNIVVAQMMFKYLNDTVERLSVEGAKSVPVGRRSSYRTSFKHACAIRLCLRIRDRIAETKRKGAKTESGTTLPALASLYDQAKQKLDAFKAENLKIRATKYRGKITDEQGYTDGKAAGDRIGLDTQVEGRRSAGLLS